MSQEKMEQLLEHATRLFQERGFRATSLEEIAEAIGIQKPSLYHYIASKEELLFLVMSRTIADYNAKLRAVVESDRPPVAKLEQAVRQHITLQLEQPGTVTLFRDTPYLTGDRMEAIRRDLKTYRDLLQAILREGVEAGELDVPDPAVTTLFILGALNFVHRWYRPDGRRSIPEIAGYYAELIRKALVRRST